MQHADVDLIRAISAAGHPVLKLESRQGYLLILPYGARVLGLLNNSGENFFWVNPALADETSARAFFSSTDWKNSGGDRTWIAPEISLFIKDADDTLNTYEVPSALDPGNYTVQESNGQLRMTNRAQIRFHHTGRDCEIELGKTIQIAANPLRCEVEAQSLLQDTEYVGYEQSTTLQLISPPEQGLRLGIWNLIQLPAGGQVIIPTLRESFPHDYFEETGPSHLRVTQRYISFRIDGQERHKIGVKASATMGRAGYIRAIGNGQKTLLIRNFPVNPSGEYIDVPWDDPDDSGYAIQCYNDDGDLGKFGELEYHAPAIGAGTGMTAYEDRSQVWAFSGTERSIDEISRLLLGVKPNGTYTNIVDKN